MKKAIQLLMITMIMLPVISFAQNAKSVWPEMKTFHSFMAATFHPADEGNFAPLKEKADSLLIAAKSWQASPIPANYKPVETKATLKKLVAQCEAIKKNVTAKASDEILKKMISEAHETFHTIMGKCRKED